MTGKRPSGPTRVLPTTNDKGPRAESPQPAHRAIMCGDFTVIDQGIDDLNDRRLWLTQSDRGGCAHTWPYRARDGTGAHLRPESRIDGYRSLVTNQVQTGNHDGDFPRRVRRKIKCDTAHCVGRAILIIIAVFPKTYKRGIHGEPIRCDRNNKIRRAERHIGRTAPDSPAHTGG